VFSAGPSARDVPSTAMNDDRRPSLPQRLARTRSANGSLLGVIGLNLAAVLLLM
jgi:hypothetical protein